MRGLLLIWLLFQGARASTQTLDRNTGDLKGALNIKLNKTYLFKRSPNGFGQIREFSRDAKRSANIFREERHSAWFTFTIPYKGILTMVISPESLKDDYDWMLYDFKSLQGRNPEEVMPLRSNNARNDAALSGKTGMLEQGNQLRVPPGPGNNYSSPVEVWPGQKLILVIDNIYGGKGFAMQLNLRPQYELITLEGTVKDKRTGKSVQAEITVEEDSTGKELARITSDAQTGRYKINVPAAVKLNLTAGNPDYLFSSQKAILKSNGKLDFALDTISKGNKLVLYNLHFYPNKDELLPGAWPELSRLTEFLKKHPEWNVRIIGHTNVNLFASNRYLQQLSFNRALAVKRFLLQNSISEKRLSCIGLGGKNPLVVTNDPQEGLRNLRVEVELVSKQ